MKTNPTPPIPVQGYLWMGRNIGIKDQSLDFGVLAAAHPCSASAVFTRSNLPGAPVIVGREHAAKGTLQAIVVNSKCANVGLGCLLYTSPSPRDQRGSRMPSSA